MELVWDRVRVEGECFWVNLREDNKVFESKMAVSDSNMADIQDGCYHQVESEWMSKVLFVQKWPNPRWRIQDGCHHQVQSEWMSEVFFVQMLGTNLGKCEWVWEKKLRWLNPRWQNSIWLPSSSSVRMNEFELIELVWVRVRMEWDCFLSESERR